MEFRLSLLQNEIEHLNKNMGLMSEELIVLKEFIRQEFSQRFQAFCNARKEKQTRHHLAGGGGGGVSTAFSESPQSTSSKSIQKSSTQSSFFEIKTEPEIDQSEFYDENEPVLMESSDDEGEEDSDYEFELYPKSKTAADPLQNSPKKGKPKALIHNYFEHIHTPDGKVRTKCFTCQEYVSNQAQRLKKHFEKCSSNNRLNMDSQVIKKITAIGYKRPSRTGEGDTNKVGRKLDRVRELFEEIHDDNGFTKMKCSSCGHLVSNQANRMKKHIEKCERITKVHRSGPQSSTSSQVQRNKSRSSSRPSFSSSSSSMHSQSGGVAPTYECSNPTLSNNHESSESGYCQNETLQGSAIIVSNSDPSSSVPVPGAPQFASEHGDNADYGNPDANYSNSNNPMNTGAGTPMQL